MEVSPCISSVARWLGSIKSSGPANSPSPTFAAPWCARGRSLGPSCARSDAGGVVGRVCSVISRPAGPVRAAPGALPGMQRNLDDLLDPRRAAPAPGPGWSAGPLSRPATPRVHSAPATAAPSAGWSAGGVPPRASRARSAHKSTIRARRTSFGAVLPSFTSFSSRWWSSGVRSRHKAIDAEQDIHAS